MRQSRIAEHLKLSRIRQKRASAFYLGSRFLLAAIDQPVHSMPGIAGGAGAHLHHPRASRLGRSQNRHRLSIALEHSIELNLSVAKRAEIPAQHLLGPQSLRISVEAGYVSDDFSAGRNYFLIESADGFRKTGADSVANAFWECCLLHFQAQRSPRRDDQRDLNHRLKGYCLAEKRGNQSSNKQSNQGESRRERHPSLSQEPRKCGKKSATIED